MAHYVLQADGGVGRQDAVDFAIPATGDDLVFLNEAGSAIEIDLQFAATLSGTIYRLNDTPTVGNNPGSLKETVSGNYTLKIGAESGVRIHVDNSANSGTADVTIPASTIGATAYASVRTTHRTAASSGDSVWIALG